MLLAGLSCLLVACAQRMDLPDVGPQLPYSARLNLAPAIAAASSQYTDSCGHIFDAHYGMVLEDALIEATHRLFKTVTLEGGGAKDQAADYVVNVDLTYSKFALKNDNLYDRVPAELTLSGTAKIQDKAGKVLREPDIQVTRQERVRVEPLQKNCNYILDPFMKDTAVEFAIKYTNEVRAALAPGAQPQAAGPGAATAAAPQTGPSPGGAPGPSDIRPGTGGLSFKTTVLDDNANLVLEGGERVKLRVEVVNAGMLVAREVAVTLTGTPSLVNQFPATTLPVGTMQPGESKSVEFAATVPQSFPEAQAELIVALSETGGVSLPPRRTIELAVRASPSSDLKRGASQPSIDQAPAAIAGFHRAQTYVLSIGAGIVRDQKAAVRKFAATDADLVAGYLGAIGGVPSANLRVLKDKGATRPDIEEAILDWLPGRVTPESLLIVYYSGQVLVAPSGEVALVPYDGGRTIAKSYPLKDFQSSLTKLRARTVLLIVDPSVMKIGGDSKTKFKSPQWDSGGASLSRLIGTSGLGSGLEPEQLGHGLFTYYLLKGLRGEADSNRDGDVTFGELSAYASESVAEVARSDYNQEQKPQAVPSLGASSKAATILARTAPLPAGR